jgi:23S rRNA pseudouridine955/2504/2580 synthase
MDFHVSASESGQKIVKFLLKNSDGSKVFLFKLFRKGLIAVNGQKADRTRELREGDVVSSRYLTGANRKPKFQSVSRRISVLFENENLIAIDKDDATVVHAGESDYKNSLLEIVKAYLHRKNEPYSAVVPVHRIDRNTKGVVIFAKNETFAKRLHYLFKNSLVDKTYEAILVGKLYKKLFIEGDIVSVGESAPVQVKNLKYSDTIPDKNQWLDNNYRTSTTLSATIMKPIRYEKNECFTIAEITIWTGRHHQIRAIAHAIGFPIVGDKKYFKAGAVDVEGRTGQELICKRIGIPDLGLSVESRYSL